MRDVDDGVGKQLRDARTRRELTLQEVEAATKIRDRYLQALENEDWDQLPGDTYARAFIRTYAGILGLDGERLAEEQRRGRGAAAPGERLPRVDPRPRRVTRKRRPARIRLGLIAALATTLVVVALLVVGSSGGGGSGGSGSSGRSDSPAGDEHTGVAGRPAPPPEPQGHALELLANGEVWVCLLSENGERLVGGEILAAGEAAGPFRSGSFTLALGNGAVTMTVDGKKQNLPEPPSPIGFAVDPRGIVSELPEGERPTCS
jgi:cytoskeleton protein RodZ